MTIIHEKGVSRCGTVTLRRAGPGTRCIAENASAQARQLGRALIAAADEYDSLSDPEGTIAP